MPAITNLQFDHGEDWLIDLSCFDAAGAPLDVSGATAVIYVGPAAAPVAQIPGTVASPGSAGIINFRLAGSAQTAVRPGAYPYTARITLSGGSVTDQAAGTLTVRNA